MFGKHDRLRLWLMYRCFDYNMADQINYPTSIQKLSGQLHLRSRISQDVLSQRCNLYNPAVYERRFATVNYLNGPFQTPSVQVASCNNGLPAIVSVSPVFAQAPAEKGFKNFAIDFLMGGVSA